MLHGSRSYLLQDDDGQVTEAHSISAGLDYPGIGPQLSALYEAGRLEILSATDDEALEGVRLLTRTEGILPALEPAHAIHALIDLLAGPRGGARPGRTTSSCWGCPVAATRTSRPSRSGSWPACRWGYRVSAAAKSAGPTAPQTAAAAAPAVTPLRPLGPGHAATRWPGRPASRPPSSRPPGRDEQRSSRTPWPATRTRRPRWRIALAQIDAGADLLEIGLPYSDPLADGATLQRASTVALRHGARLDDSIELVGRIHAARPDTPLVAMGYVNQVLGGRDGATVLRRLGEAGVSGFILADLTPDEGAELEAEAARHGIGIVYLVAPTTPVERRA